MKFPHEAYAKMMAMEKSASQHVAKDVAAEKKADSSESAIENDDDVVGSEQDEPDKDFSQLNNEGGD